MKAYAFIPARGGSKRIVGKNLREVGGVSLVRRAIIAAHGAGCRVVVSTDDAEIEAAAAGYAEETGNWVDVHIRPAHTATDHAQIESAIAAWWRSTWWRDTDDDKPDAIVLLQPTSPFRTAEHVREALRLLGATGADSVVGVTDVSMAHAFAADVVDGWLQPRRQQGTRTRSQDVPKVWRETGALYAFTRVHWERTGDRMGGRMQPLYMNEIESMDIDSEDDLAICDAIASAKGI